MEQNLLSLHPENFWGQTLSGEDILEFFNQCDAAWLHDGNSKKPHVELTSGKCSNGYFNCSLLLCYPNLAEILGYQLAEKFMSTVTDEIDWVLSSSYAAITFGHEVAKAIGAKFGFTEKDPENSKKQIWKRFTIPKGSNVLQAEELITTSGTFKAVRQAVIDGNPEPVNFCNKVCALVHRPPELPINYDGISIVALVEKKVWAVEQKDCHLCNLGSKRLKPKSNWAELTGKA